MVLYIVAGISGFATAVSVIVDQRLRAASYAPEEYPAMQRGASLTRRYRACLWFAVVVWIIGSIYLLIAPDLKMLHFGVVALVGIITYVVAARVDQSIQARHGHRPA